MIKKNLNHFGCGFAQLLAGRKKERCGQGAPSSNPVILPITVQCIQHVYNFKNKNTVRARYPNVFGFRMVDHVHWKLKEMVAKMAQNRNNKTFRIRTVFGIPSSDFEPQLY